jgi:hypothetical protein
MNLDYLIVKRMKFQFIVHANERIFLTVFYYLTTYLSTHPFGGFVSFLLKLSLSKLLYGLNFIYRFL